MQSVPVWEELAALALSGGQPAVPALPHSQTSRPTCPSARLPSPQCTIYQGLTDGSDIWKFDKRFFTREDDYMDIQPIPMPPPFAPGEWKFIEGKPVTLDVHQAIEQMVEQMNRGIATLGLLQPASNTAATS